MNNTKIINEVEFELPLLDMCLNDEYMVVQANKLIESKQPPLKLNSAKILRALIMQIKPEDQDVYTYKIKIPELSKLLKIDKSNLYQEMDKITTDLLSGYVEMKSYKRKEFLKIHWLSSVAYSQEEGLTMHINPEMKPFLLQLKQKHIAHTQYELMDIILMQSVYAIRIYELLNKSMYQPGVPVSPPMAGMHIILSVQDIREACACEEKMLRMDVFTKKVLDVAVHEINRCSMYNVTYEKIKKGREVTDIDFFVNTKVHEIILGWKK